MQREVDQCVWSIRRENLHSADGCTASTFENLFHPDLRRPTNALGEQEMPVEIDAGRQLDLTRDLVEEVAPIRVDDVCTFRLERLKRVANLERGTIRSRSR